MILDHYGAHAGAIGATMPDEDTTRRVRVHDRQALAAGARARVERETWADWWPDEPTDPEGLLTREELAERARAEGIPVSASEIANWQSAGVIPSGIPHRVGRTLARLYPERYLGLLRDVRGRQAEGWRLAAVGPWLRREHAGRGVVRRGKGGGSAAATFAGRARGHVRRGDPILTADAALAETLRAIVREHEATYGGRIAEVRLTLVDDHGNPLTLAIGTD